AADPELGGGAFPAVAAALHQGVHRLLLGDRHLVAPYAAAARCVAPRLSALSSALRPTLLGRGLPPGHVRHRDAPDDCGVRFRFPLLFAAAVRVHRSCRVDSDRCGADSLPAATHERFSSLGVGAIETDSYVYTSARLQTSAGRTPR